MKRPELPERRGRGLWWNPWMTGIDRLQEEISRVFDDFASRFVPPVLGGGAVSVDVYRKDGNVIVEAEMPGIDPRDVDIKVYEDKVLLRAEKGASREVESEDVIRSERYYGKISRVISLPVEVIPEKAKAKFKNGLLTIAIPEKEPEEEGGYRINIETED